MKQQKLLYLGLSAFSGAGGIEKVNKTWFRALSQIIKEDLNFNAYILLDSKPEEKYIASKNFKGFKGNKLLFLAQSFYKALFVDLIIASHINLGPFIRLIKLLKPKTRIILQAHGIEIWDNISPKKKKTLLQVDRVIAVSKYTKAQIINNYGVDAAKIAVINNALDPYFNLSENLEKPDYLLKRYQLNKEQHILYTLARLSSSEQYKGYDLVLKVLPNIIKDYPYLMYIIGGKADKKEAEHLQQLINDHHLENNVKLIGFVADAELNDHYALADTFIMPSRNEGFGIVFIEAAAAGCHLIAGNLDGSTDALLNGALGELINPTDLAQIELAIRNTISKPTHRKNQQALAFNNFNFDNYQKKISDLLNEFNT